MKYKSIDLSNITEKIENYFVEKFQNDDNVLSLFLIGSMSNKDYIPLRYNDYDLRVLVDSPTVEIINKIKDCATDIIEQLRLSFPNYEFYWSDKIGPVRHINTVLPTFTLHVLVFTEFTLSELPVMHRYSYAQGYEILYGNDYIKQFVALRLSAEELIKDIEGIQYCRKCLVENSYSYQIWLEKNGKYVLENKTELLKGTTKYEFFRYSVSKSYVNAHIFATQNNDKKLLFNLKGINSEKESLMDVSFEDFTIAKRTYINRAIMLLTNIEYLLLPYCAVNIRRFLNETSRN